ncbi:ribosome silencing factor [Prosthecochloris sp. GSB1]|uniref:ribosome silencing factor n=1 Tax=Prosthecochloris sp. GSB1 TaxID=281093 RepID=UPI000B8C8FFD|nr:ribosome silencing factor [Prosthecochloris sp. GSB1]ASQ91543.1 ribosome silencing factor [Prosthecochloris sp. GSB1]
MAEVRSDERKAVQDGEGVREVSTSELLANRAAELSLEKKCEEVMILDVRGLTSVTDFFVIASADSERKVKAAYEYIVDELKHDDERPLNVEGTDLLHWVLLDYVDVVIHIFMPDERRFYDLESLWSDAPRQTLKASGEALSAED